MSDIFAHTLSVLTYIFEGFCAFWLFDRFSEPRIKRREAGKYAAGALWTFCGIVSSFAFEGNSEKQLLIKLGIYILVMFAFSLLWYSGGILRRIFPAALFIALRELSAQSANCLVCMSEAAVKLLVSMAERNVISYESLVPAAEITIRTFIVFIEAVKEALIYFSVSRIIKNKRYEIGSEKEAAIYLLPSVVGIMLSAFVRLIAISIEDGNAVLIFNRYPSLYAVIPAVSLTLLAAVVLNFKLCQDITGLQIGRSEKSVLENQIEHIKNSLDETERFYEKLRSVRHDMKNSLATLQSLLEKKCPDDEEINRFFAEMNISSADIGSPLHTGNAVSDAVIGRKFRYAENVVPGIKLDADSFIFKDETIKAYDMGVILNNGLDNAVEACVRLKEKFPKSETYITVRSFKMKNMLFVEIENSFDGVLRRKNPYADGEGGLPLSLKDDPETHGIGLHNIKSCAEKYSGGIDCIAEDGKFILSVMLKTSLNK